MEDVQETSKTVLPHKGYKPLGDCIALKGSVASWIGKVFRKSSDFTYSK